MNSVSDQQPPWLTLGAAAKVASVAKPTLSRAIKEGRLSAEKQPDGSYRIQAAELFRVYPPATPANSLPASNLDQPTTGTEIELLRGEIARLREQLGQFTDERDRERQQLTEQIDYLRRLAEIEGEERRKLTAILTDQRKPEPAAISPQKPVGGRLSRAWSILRGKG